jgi:hypothetical protein
MYSIVQGWDPFNSTRLQKLHGSSDEQLEKWSKDRDCKEHGLAAEELEGRIEQRRALAKRREEEEAARTARRQELGELPVRLPNRSIGGREAHSEQDHF